MFVKGLYGSLTSVGTTAPAGYRYRWTVVRTGYGALYSLPVERHPLDEDDSIFLLAAASDVWHLRTRSHRKVCELGVGRRASLVASGTARQMSDVEESALFEAPFLCVLSLHFSL